MHIDNVMSNSITISFGSLYVSLQFQPSGTHEMFVRSAATQLDNYLEIWRTQSSYLTTENVYISSKLCKLYIILDSPFVLYASDRTNCGEFRGFLFLHIYLKVYIQFNFAKVKVLRQHIYTLYVLP